MLASIKDILYSKRRIIIFALILIIAYFLFNDIALAEGEPATPPAGGANTPAEGEQESVAYWIKIIQGVAQVASVLVALMTYLATMFLSPEWINGSLFNMTYYFRQVWILISNVVYLIFAFILVFIAFMNIIGKNENYQIKKILPKFIIGILMVPLSWFIVQFVLSLSAILTITALNLPFDTFAEYEQNIGSVKLPKNCVIDLANGSTNGSGSVNPFGFLDCGNYTPGKGTNQGSWSSPGGGSGENNIELRTLLGSGNSADSIFGVVGTYTYGVMGFDNLDKLTGLDSQKIKTITDLLLKVVFDIVFFFIYLIIIVALGIVLFTRGIYIWIYVMISPLFGLMHFFGTKEGGGNFFSKFSIMEFVKLAFVPVFAMAALSFGLLFLYVVGRGLTIDNGTGGISAETSNGTVKIQEGKEKDTSELIIGKEGLTLTIKGAASSTKDAVDFLGTVGNGVLGVIGSLIMKVFGIVVLWGTIMAALSTSKVTEEIIKPLVDFGNQVGSIVKQAPMYAPILPGGASIASAGVTGSRLKGYVDQLVGTDRHDKTWGKLIPDVQDTRNAETARRAVSTDDVKGAVVAHRNSLGGDLSRLGDENKIRQLEALLDSEALKGMDKETKASLRTLLKNFSRTNYGTFIAALEKHLGIDLDGDNNTDNASSSTTHLNNSLNGTAQPSQVPNPTGGTTPQPKVDMGSKGSIELKYTKTDGKVEVTLLNNEKTGSVEIGDINNNRANFKAKMIGELKEKGVTNPEIIAEEIAKRIFGEE